MRETDHSRYSLFSPVTTHIKAIGKVIRAMENSLHSVLDVTMNEYRPLPAAPSKC